MSVRSQWSVIRGWDTRYMNVIGHQQYQRVTNDRLYLSFAGPYLQILFKYIIQCIFIWMSDSMRQSYSLFHSLLLSVAIKKKVEKTIIDNSMISVCMSNISLLVWWINHGAYYLRLNYGEPKIITIITITIYIIYSLSWIPECFKCANTCEYADQQKWQEAATGTCINDSSNVNTTQDRSQQQP